MAPNPKNTTLLKFINSIHADIETFIDDSPLLKDKYNCTPEEFKSLKNLSKNKDIVIKKADKGGSIVIMNKYDYVDKVRKHLDNKTYYSKILTDPTKDLITNIHSFIETLLYHHKIDKNTAKFITPTSPIRMPLFYILPKIHKDGNPGRPIVSAVNSPTENISEFLNLCLQPLLPKLKSYIKDTKHFITRINNLPKIKKNAILVSADVTSLYTNIPHKEGVDACIHFMNIFQHHLPNFTPNEQVTRVLFSFILENNYFQFLDEIFLQLIGTAMGTKVAPPYASLFLGLFEETHIFKRFPGLLTIYLRFLDDIFFIWEHGENKLKEFFTYLNSVHPTIKFTYKYSIEEIDFLDTTVYLDPATGDLKTKLYIKPTDTRTLLHYNSYHPYHTKQSIVYSQALRYRMITKDNILLQKELDQLKNNLLLRGYKFRMVNSTFKQVLNMNQEDVLNNNVKKLKDNKNNDSANGRKINNKKKRSKIDGISSSVHNNDVLPFIIPYHRAFIPVKNIFRKHWSIIINDRELHKVFPNKPFIAFTRHKNIQDHLVRTKLGTGD
ncbi:uncharacterized protein LOC130623279 [Hydractinia symbiolongicarpus]|uniref:uncharacterized protein LOC130623279 n=1 Tax=Hydractinia symbiolongicarpus TaxID=13093 RepID=UPI00254CF58C|nr:uncharacterized protein LOC130623279 [Hydractinia symbiolongicarpus]